MVKVGLRITKYYEPTERDPFRKTTELAILAEEMGFDFATFGHRVVMENNPWHAAPLVALAALAARTSKIRLATSILILPLYHPLTVAEQVGQLDQISGGRVIFGVGLGYRDYEFAAHGVNVADRVPRMVESLQVIRQGWQQGYFELDGKHFKIPRSVVDPVPIQKPHPPIWVGGASDGAIKRAALYGDGWLTGNAETSDRVAERVATYHRYCDQAGRPRGTLTVLRNAWVAATKAEVEREWLEPTLKYQLDHRRSGSEQPDEDGMFARLMAGGTVTLEEFAAERGIAGRPEDCIAQIRRWHEKTGCDYLNLMFTGEGGFEAQKRVIEMFGKEVIPHV